MSLKGDQAMNIEVCLFWHEEGDLHQILTFDADSSIRAMITELQDTLLLASLLAWIEGGDLIAREVKYHLKCLVNLRNRYRSFKTNSNKTLNWIID